MPHIASPKGCTCYWIEHASFDFKMFPLELTWLSFVWTEADREFEKFPNQTSLRIDFISGV